MGKEIERKFLIWEDGKNYGTAAFRDWYAAMGGDTSRDIVQALRAYVLRDGVSLHQGYFPNIEGETVRELADLVGFKDKFKPTEARLRNKGEEQFYFTLKGPGGVQRDEFDPEIEKIVFARYWPGTQGSRVEKVRLARGYGEHTAEIDLYTDRDLIVIEVEVLTLEEAERLVPLGKDVTEDKAYKNRNLAR
ncbi:hypothetical protein HY495_03825 [Candidatus Woesearchaeota archaeon]|nr:hypothetical protein [Candidatus Woesearchaeota archaeon]